MTKIKKSSGIGKFFIGVLKSMWAVILAAIVGIVSSLALTAWLAEPKYEADTLIYFEILSDSDASSRFESVGEAEDFCRIVLQSQTTVERIAEASETEHSVEDLKKMLKIKSLDSTYIFSVRVIDNDEKGAALLASTAADVLTTRLTELLDGVKVKQVESVGLSGHRSYAYYYINASVGGALLSALMLIIIISRTVKDAYIRKKSHLENTFDIPVLSTVPHSKNPVLCDKLSGIRGEAYKRLRANIGFCFMGFDGSKVIGVTSAHIKECKTTTAINLAYSMAQSGKRVLLIDGDMRRPSISAKLEVVSKTGLPDLLAGTGKKEDAIKRKSFAASGVEFDIISTGEMSAISSELLGSNRMKMLLDDLKEKYNCIVVDLPSACRFSDAAVLSQYADGMLISVRANHSKSTLLVEAVSQFEFAKANILGFVYY